MPKNDNPEALENLNDIPITQELKTKLVDLASDISYEKQKRAWWDTNTDNYINQRYGIREVKNFPWPNCANYVIPLIDSDINRIKPAYANLIDVFPVVIFEPYGDEDMEAAENHEIYFDWLLRAKMDFFQSYMLGLDYLLEQGVVIFKITWKYSTRTYTEEIDLAELDQQVLAALYDPRVTDEVLEKIFVEEFEVDEELEDNIKEIQKAIKKFREGKSKFKLTLMEVAEDRPEICPRSLRYDITFPVETTDINKARFIDDKFQISFNDLKIAMRDKKYAEYSNETIKAWASTYANDYKRRPGQRTLSGTVNSTPDEDNIWLHETCVWHDINDDGIKERCIVTWPDAQPEMILRFIEMPYEHYMWPYVAVKRELNDPGYFASRGIPALDLDFQLGLSTGFNQSVDNGTVTNTPQVVVKENSLVNPRNLRYVPGERVVVRTQLTDYETRVIGNNSQGFLLQAGQYLKSWANERIGNVSSALSNPNNQPGQGLGGQKTAKEVNAVEQIGTEIQSLDLQVFQQQMSLVYYQIDALDNQFGDQEQISFISGGKAQKFTRQEIQGKFKYVPNGKLDNSNPALRAAKSIRMMQMFMNDPDIKQREMKRIALDDLDVRITRKIFKTDEEKDQEAKGQAQALQKQKMETIQTQLMLHKAGKQIDVQGDLSKSQGEAHIDILKEAGFSPNEIQDYMAQAQIDVWKEQQLAPIEIAKQRAKPKASVR